MSGDATFIITCKYTGTDNPSSVVWKINDVVKTDSDDYISIVQNGLVSDKRFERYFITPTNIRMELDFLLKLSNNKYLKSAYTIWKVVNVK